VIFADLEESKLYRDFTPAYSLPESLSFFTYNFVKNRLDHMWIM
jgi:hypothetical protein